MSQALGDHTENVLVITAHQPGRDGGKGLQGSTICASMGDWGMLWENWKGLESGTISNLEGQGWLLEEVTSDLRLKDIVLYQSCIL